MAGPVFNDTGDFAPTEVQVVHFRFLKGEYMKKLLTLLCALVLSASLAMAQAGGGSTTGSTTSTDTTTTTHKGHKGGKKGHKGGKKGKKGSGDTGTTPPPK